MIKLKEDKLTRTNENKSVYYGDGSTDCCLGKRNKLGGKPDWIQGDNTPTCPICGKKMVFYGQLDSINRKCQIVDAGMIYVFYCFDCFEAKAVVQFY